MLRQAGHRVTNTLANLPMYPPPMPRLVPGHRLRLGPDNRFRLGPDHRLMLEFQPQLTAPGCNILLHDIQHHTIRHNVSSC